MGYTVQYTPHQMSDTFMLSELHSSDKFESTTIIRSHIPRPLCTRKHKSETECPGPTVFTTQKENTTTSAPLPLHSNRLIARASPLHRQVTRERVERAPLRLQRDGVRAAVSGTDPEFVQALTFPPPLQDTLADAAARAL